MFEHFPMPPRNYELEEAVAMRIHAEQRDAEYTFLALKRQIESLQEEATRAGQEVGLVVPLSGDVVHVRQVGWEGRNVVFINGDLKGARVRLVVHHTQLQVLLVPVEPSTGKPARVLYLVPDVEKSEG